LYTISNDTKKRRKIYEKARGKNRIEEGKKKIMQKGNKLHTP